MKYMLDTNIVIYVKEQRSAEVLKRFLEHPMQELCISAITMAELEYGVFKSTRPNRNQLALTTFLARLEVMPFDSSAALEYGAIRANLESRGQLIGGNDMLIAAHAKSLDLTLVTNNTKEFERVKGLRVENWA